MWNVCRAPECTRRRVAKGLCAGHYWQIRRGELLRPLQVQHHGLTEVQRFSKWVDKRGPDDCWPWKGSINKNGGHGQFATGKSGGEPAHRAAWRLFVGPIADGFWVCHRCDNAPCCNPSHLFLGTPSDNALDMWAKNRANPGKSVGEQHGAAKLNAEIVADIRKSTLSGVQLAAMYGVSPVTVGAVRRRKTWKHIP